MSFRNVCLYRHICIYIYICICLYRHDGGDGQFYGLAARPLSVLMFSLWTEYGLRESETSLWRLLRESKNRLGSLKIVLFAFCIRPLEERSLLFWQWMFFFIGLRWNFFLAIFILTFWDFLRTWFRNVSQWYPIICWLGLFNPNALGTLGWTSWQGV